MKHNCTSDLATPNFDIVFLFASLLTNANTWIKEPLQAWIEQHLCNVEHMTISNSPNTATNDKSMFGIISNNN